MGVVGPICCRSFVRRFAPITTAPAAAMPGIEKLPIEETLEDSPQVTAPFPGGLWLAARRAKLTVFVGSVFANRQRRDAELQLCAHRPRPSSAKLSSGHFKRGYGSCASASNCDGYTDQLMGSFRQYARSKCQTQAQRSVLVCTDLN